MKIDRLTLIIFLLFSTSYLFPQKNADSESKFEIDAEKIISKMTLEEKASQMLNASIALYDYGLDEYNWWNESLGIPLCVARRVSGIIVVSPCPPMTIP